MRCYRQNSVFFPLQKKHFSDYVGLNSGFQTLPFTRNKIPFSCELTLICSSRSPAGGLNDFMEQMKWKRFFLFKHQSNQSYMVKIIWFNFFLLYYCFVRSNVIIPYTRIPDKPHYLNSNKKKKMKINRLQFHC